MCFDKRIQQLQTSLQMGLQPCLCHYFTQSAGEPISYGSSPSRRGPDSREAIRSNTRSPRFRPVPFVRDGVFDHDGASAPRIAAPYILPSALGDGLGLRGFKTFAAQYPTPHNHCVRFVAAVADGLTQHSLPGGRYPLPGTGLSPAGPDQLLLAHPPIFRQSHAPLEGGKDRHRRPGSVFASSGNQADPNRHKWPHPRRRDRHS
jgi:hypothetical protein